MWLHVHFDVHFSMISGSHIPYDYILECNCATEVAMSLHGIVPSFSSSVTFKFCCLSSLNLMMHGHLMMMIMVMMTNDLSCQQVIPSLPLCSFLFQFVAFAGIFVGIFFFLQLT